MSWLPTADEMRRVDLVASQRHGLTRQTLMERAGRGVAEFVLARLSAGPRPAASGRRIVVIAGPGNNGGDGLVAARILKERGLPVTTVEVKNARAADWQKAIGEATIVIDALFGTGLNRTVDGTAREIIETINKRGRLAAPPNPLREIVSIDIPSGLSADTGEPLGVAVRATATLTLAAPKLGLSIGKGPEYAGGIETIDIGIPEGVFREVGVEGRLIGPDDFRPLLRPREKETHKGTYGHLLLVGGAVNRLGAILLAARAALRTGAGLVTVALPAGAFKKIPAGLTEVMYEPIGASSAGRFSASALKPLCKLIDGKEAAAVGPGLGVTPAVRALVTGLVRRSPVPMVLDADALNALKGRTKILKTARQTLVLTPHPGEFSRLTGLTMRQVQRDRVGIARRFAREHRVILLLKGFHTIVAVPDGRYFINPTGNPGMATAGMGDILTGMIGSLLVQTIAGRLPATPLEAVLAGVYLHGLAGDRVAARLGGRGLIASEVADEVPLALKELS